MSNTAVVDTNVPVVANGKSDQASTACVIACVEALLVIQNGRRIVLDDGYRIFNEYKSGLSFSGQPGVGDAFFKWLHQNMHNPKHCELVAIHPRTDSPDEFHEFPNDPALATFDLADRKFVAVARAHPSRPPILNAVDSDWWDHREILKSYHVEVEFLCNGHFEDSSTKRKLLTRRSV